MFLKLKREIEAKDIDLGNSRESVENLQEKILALVKEKEELVNTNDKLDQESKTFQNRIFELQAKIIDTEIEIAKVKKEQVGPIVKKKR